MRLRFSFLGLAAVCLLLSNPEPAAAAKVFRWKLEAGDRLQVDMGHKMKQSTTSAGKAVDVSSDMVMYTTWEVDSATDGTFHITQSTQRITQSIKGPAGDLNYDSASPEEPTGRLKTIADMFRPLIGAKFTHTMDARGKVLSVGVPADALKGLDANPLLKQFFSGDSYKEIMSKASPVLPKDAIDKGYRWQNKVETKTPVGTMKMESAYVYKGEEQRDGRALDKFGVSSTVTFANAPPGTKIDITDQAISGVMYFDTAVGRFVETRATQKFTIEVTVGEENLSQKMEVTVEMKVKPAP